MIGETIGKYRIVARLGRGGVGTVYKAVDQTLEREVAIKVVNPGLTERELLKRFRAEAITLARLNHPNIATLYELGQHGDELLMVMEFVRGETFDKLSERVGPMPFERAAYLIAQVLDALGHAHREGIVHRDMKPGNLILSESGVVKVMDFGIARMVGAEHLTSDGDHMGNPAYMAPEQVTGGEVDGRADLYGVGVILYRLLTSHLPLKADTASASVPAHGTDQPGRLRQLRADLPVWCGQILDRALAQSPEARYQTADEFRSALMLSAALAPVTEVTTVLAAGGVAAGLQMPVAQNSGGMSATPPAPPAATPASAARVAAPAPVFIPIAEAPSPHAFRAANPAAPQLRTAPGAPAAARTRAYLGFILFLGAAAVAAVLLVTVWQPSPGDSLATPSPPAAASSAAVVPPATAPAVQTAPVQSAAAVSPPPAAASPPPAASPARRERSTPAPVSIPPPAAERPAPTATSRPVLPSMSFTPVRFLMVGGARPTERETSLQLTGDALALTGKEATGAIKSVPYSTMIAIFHSRSREPQWIGPSGVVLSIVKMDRGMFGFMKGNRDWVSVRTKAEFLMLRPDGPLVARLIEAIEARTGLTAVRVGKRAAGTD
jgi:hypothetical protein